MIVDLLNVGDRPIQFDFQIEPDKVDLDSETIRILSKVNVSGELRRNSAKTEVTGLVRAPLEIDCTRCLAPVKRDLDIAFQVDFIGRELFPDIKETHLESGDLDTDVIEGNELDLTALAREQILLNLPEQVLCREDCKGICPTCGADLNENECECREDDIDPRWSALKDLRS